MVSDSNTEHTPATHTNEPDSGKPTVASEQASSNQAIAVLSSEPNKGSKIEKRTDHLPALANEIVSPPATTPLEDLSPEILLEEIGTGPLPDLDKVLEGMAKHDGMSHFESEGGITTETRGTASDDAPKEPAAGSEQPATSSPIRFDPPKIEAVPQRQDSLPPRPFSKPDPTRETAVLSDNNPILKRMIRQTTTAGTASLGEGREIILVIRGMVERIIITEGKKYKLGRFELSSRTVEEIDLSPYGALDRGVSRVHAELSLKGEHIYITDLTSTNGTYLAGTRLKPNEPTLLRKGDELLIGRLPVQVLFR